MKYKILALQDRAISVKGTFSSNSPRNENYKTKQETS